MRLSFDEMVSKISEKSGLGSDVVIARVDKKLDDLAGLVSKEGAAHIVANELGVDLLEGVSTVTLVKDIVSGMRSVDVAGCVHAVYEVRDFVSQRGAGKVGSFLLADNSATVRVTCWNSLADTLKELKSGDIVSIKNAYVRDNNGRLEVHLNDRSVLEINPAGVVIDAPKPSAGGVGVAPSGVRKSIKDIVPEDVFVEVLGTVVQVFDPHYFEICPQCSKRVRQRQEGFACDEHGVVTPAFSCVLNAVLDDGSENIRAVFFRDQAAAALGKSVPDLIVARESRETVDSFKSLLLGKMVKVTAKVTNNQMFNRLELMVRSVNTSPDPAEELKRLEDEKNKILQK
jgi:hypothetical protein